ncbi:MAG: site-2 protease family protein [Actinomycetota bacterium]
MSTPLDLLRSDPLAFVLLAVSIIFAIALHEFAHAWAADSQGDRLPRAMGRLSLNPARHLDPLGTIFIVLVGFGWGKPVEFRPTALRSKRFGGAIVALAGPAMNLVLAFVGAIGARLSGVNLVSGIPDGLAGQVGTFFLTFSSINVILAVFNLIPLPPLDGSRLLTIFLPPSKQKIIYFLDRYGFIILLGLVFFGGFSVLQPLLIDIQGFVLRTIL